MIHIESFGYLHGEPPAHSDLVLDARHLIRDPHVDPALRQLTGRDQAVQDAVMGTPGATALADFVRQAATAADEGDDTWTRVAIGYQGGRHRSVVLADVVGKMLSQDGFLVQIYDRDIDKDVVERPAAPRPLTDDEEEDACTCGRAGSGVGHAALCAIRS